MVTKSVNAPGKCLFFELILYYATKFSEKFNSLHYILTDLRV